MMVYQLWGSSGKEENRVPDDPGVAFIEALDLMTRTMMKHPWTDKVVRALPQDERDELRAGTPIFQATAYMDLIQRRVSTEVDNGNQIQDDNGSG